MIFKTFSRTFFNFSLSKKDNRRCSHKLMQIFYLDKLTWSMDGKGDYITYNGTTIECKQADEGEDNHSIIFTNKPIPKRVEKFYFELKVEDEGENGLIGIGLVNADAKHPNERMPGWDNGTVGYHGDDGGIFQNAGWSHTCESYSKGDTVGCMFERVLIDGYQIQLVSFTKNGTKLTPNRYLEDGEYYPAIGMGSAGAKVTSNLGEMDYIYKFEGKFDFKFNSNIIFISLAAHTFNYY